MKPSPVTVFGWVSLVVVGVPAVGWALSVAVVVGNHQMFEYRKTCMKTVL